MEPIKEITKTERGWAGHFICSNRCKFRRNTLIESSKGKIVVSTVGLMKVSNGKINEIGYNRYYETMAFKAKYEKPYWESDVSKEVPFDSEWMLNEKERESDVKANEMHEAVVSEIIDKLTTGEL